MIHMMSWGWLHIQLDMVDQIVLNNVSQKSHASKLWMVWSTNPAQTLCLILLKKTGKNAEQLDTWSAQSSARLFSDVSFHIQNFVGNESWLVLMLGFARWCSCWGPWSQIGGNNVKKSCLQGSRLDISARCGPFNAIYFFQTYRGVFGRIGSFSCGFWVVPEVLKIEMWETLKKVEKSTYCARAVCCCMNFENVEFFLNVMHVYQLAGHLDGGDIPLSDRKKNRRRFEKVCKSWMKIRTQSSTSRLGIEK
jgi:hypothetical protein